jgi:hypothetical protein
MEPPISFQNLISLLEINRVNTDGAKTAGKSCVDIRHSASDASVLNPMAVSRRDRSFVGGARRQLHVPFALDR